VTNNLRDATIIVVQDGLLVLVKLVAQTTIVNVCPIADLAKAKD